MPPSKPVCFVAMAFNKADTDALYDKQILPILNNNGIKPVIINRRQSNQDLNIQIIEQLRSCDFCTTDLTYARQSVYYEAGFAERIVPVIYTVRRDHLQDGQPEDRRVHFDLQMKPLVTWDSPTDPSFTPRLERRLRGTVLKEWKRKQQKQARLAAYEARFDDLSQGEKLALLRRRTISRLRSKGFHSWQARYHPSRPFTQKQIRTGSVNEVRSVKTIGRTLHLVTVNAFPSVTKSILQSLSHGYGPGLLGTRIEIEIPEGVEAIMADHFVLSLRDVPASRIEDVLSHHRPAADRSVYSATQHYRHVQFKPRDRVFMPDRFISRAPTALKSRIITGETIIPLTSSWHFLAKVKTELDLRQFLTEHIDMLARS
jgi:hypothetical protein